MARFKKGRSGNPKGRPKGSLNKDNPKKKLQQALSSNYDIKDLKKLILEYITDDDTKMSSKDIKDLLKLAMDVEVKLLKIAFEEEKEKTNFSTSAHDQDEDFDEDDDDPIPQVSLKAQ